MLFKRKPREGASFGEKPPDEQSGGKARADPTTVLRDELGFHHLWYLDLRLGEEQARVTRSEGVFSLCGWRLRLLPGETLPPDVLARAADLIVKSLRTYDIVARIDDERIAALLIDADYQNTSTVAYRIKADLQTKLPSSGRWQAGVATFGRDGADADALIHTMFRRLEDDARAA
jgi:hypothetical protein